MQSAVHSRAIRTYCSCDRTGPSMGAKADEAVASGSAFRGGWGGAGGVISSAKQTPPTASTRHRPPSCERPRHLQPHEKASSREASIPRFDGRPTQLGHRKRLVTPVKLEARACIKTSSRQVQFVFVLPPDPPALTHTYSFQRPHSSSARRTALYTSMPTDSSLRARPSRYLWRYMTTRS